MAFDWFRSYTTEWELVPMDPKAWVDESPLTMVKSFRFSTNGDDDVPLLQSGSITIDTMDDDPPPGWYKIRAKFHAPTGEVEYYPFGVLLCEASDYSHDFSIGTVSMPGKSVLQPAKTHYMRNGEFIPKGSSGAEWCRDILSMSTPAPVVIADNQDFTVNQNYVFDTKTSCIKAVWQVLDAGKWVIQIDGNGVIHLLPKPKFASVRFENEALSLFTPGLSRNTSISDIPNVYICNYGNRRVRVVNDDPESIVSTVSLGYEKQYVDTDPVLINGEDLDHYCRRMLEEKSTLVRTYSYTREIWEELAPFDKAYFNIPAYTGEARVISQSFDTSNGGVSIDEMVGEEVKLWRMK